MGGFFKDNGLFLSKSPHVVHHNAATCTRTVLATRVQEAVNATVYALNGQHAHGRGNHARNSAFGAD
jgi:hypothetical protein